MKTRHAQQIATISTVPEPDFPDQAALAALRGWYAGLRSRAAVTRYPPQRKAFGESARGMLGHIRRQLDRLRRKPASP
ncbi:hypothetical protein GIY62_20875 [Burkholderia plantarii]|nr:hypothetical protein GIY62_20875 [Burkholderia plantarii]